MYIIQYIQWCFGCVHNPVITVTLAYSAAVLYTGMLMIIKYHGTFITFSLIYIYSFIMLSLYLTCIYVCVYNMVLYRLVLEFQGPTHCVGQLSSNFISTGFE
jgi:small-conductance mechanosensitive channel